MDALEILSEIAPRPTLSLYQIEVLSVAVTLVVYACMLVIAVGIVKRGSSFGVPLRNFLSGLIMSSLGIVFAEPGSESTPAGLMNKCGVTVQGFVCLVILAYSSDFNGDARLAAVALVVFSLLINLKDHVLLVTLLWSTLHLVYIPGLDYLRSRKSGVSSTPDTLVLTLYLSGSLSLIGWGSYIYLAGSLLLSLPYFLGTAVSLLSLRDMYATKIKIA
ncbi:uncharacterized protein LOC100901192 [Galendromus occidentalis]|uniref:Uncharacterized protein LOC100901192 n=1 Tax=Galendromus occidentalis TaxID=34638 RepID=A0AAJ6QP41_9ACAR|nr:uncharacterized protein LOC100901192 [Galendromus occidentalis]